MNKVYKVKIAREYLPVESDTGIRLKRPGKSFREYCLEIQNEAGKKSSPDNESFDSNRSNQNLTFAQRTFVYPWFGAGLSPHVKTRLLEEYYKSIPQLMN